MAFKCADLLKNNTIVKIEEGFPEPAIYRSSFSYQCYEICTKEDLLLDDYEEKIVDTGITIRVPEGHVIIVHRSYPINGCEVEYETYYPAEGEIRLKIKIFNPECDNVIVYRSSRFAQMYLKKDME